MSNDNFARIAELLKEEFKRRLILESMPRIEKCLAWLNTQQIWYRPNDQSNSIGNLLLHLNGNVRQWILNGLGGQPDFRHRDEEFTARELLTASQLIFPLQETMQQVVNVVDKLTPEDLVHKRPVQCYEETGVSILMHVAEHFSYHTGQIAYITKALEGKDLAFYDGQALNKTQG